MMGDAIEREDVGLVHTCQAGIWRNPGDQVYGRQRSAGGMERGAMFCSPSVALPRVSFQYFGAHGPHGLRILTPGAFVSRQTQSDSRPPTRIPLPPRVFRTFIRADRAGFGQLFPSYVRSERKKKRKFVCAWSSVPGNRLMGHRSADAILGTVCDSQSLSSVRLDHCTPLPPSPPSSVLDPSCWPFRQQTRFFVDYHGFTTRHHHAPTLPVHHPAIARLVEFKTPTLLFSSFPAVSQTQSSQSCRFGWLPSSRLRPQLSYPFCNQSFFGHPKLGLAHPPSLSSHSRERASPAQHPQQHAPKLRINTPRLSSASKRSRCVKLDAPLRPESY